MFNFIKSSFRDNKDYFDTYVASLSAKYDDYLEDHILDSEIYSVIRAGAHIGYFGLFEERLLTQFFLTTPELRHGQTVLEKIIKDFAVRNAYVPTCDELFLAFAMDIHKKVDLQAYIFTDSQKAVRPAEYPQEMLRLAKLADLPDIIAVTGDFMNKLEQRILDEQIFVLCEEGILLGIGVMIRNRIMTDCIGTGMFTNEKYRKRGVGRSIILHLRDRCYAAGCTPIPSCWYHNHTSRRTLESAGYVTKTRLLNVRFQQQGENDEQ